MRRPVSVKTVLTQLGRGTGSIRTIGKRWKNQPSSFALPGNTEWECHNSNAPEKDPGQTPLARMIPGWAKLLGYGGPARAMKWPNP